MHFPPKLQLTIRREGHVHEQFYSLGEPDAPLAIIGNTEKRGRRFVSGQVWIFSNKTEFEYKILSKRLRELSF